eukprot:Awhi_evm1s15331
MKYKVFACLMCFFGQTFGKDLFIWNLDNLKTLKKNFKNEKSKPMFQSSLSFIKEEIDKMGALSGERFSVTQQEIVPGSEDIHDYQSLGYYAWPCKEAEKKFGFGEEHNQCDYPRSECKSNKEWGSYPWILCDGIANEDVVELTAKTPMQKMTRTVSAGTLYWYFTGEEKYAKMVAEVLRFFFLNEKTRMNPNLQWTQYRPGNPFVGQGIIEFAPWGEMVEAIALLRTSSYWSEGDHKNLMNWFNELLMWLKTSPMGEMEMNLGNNHATWVYQTIISLGLHAGEFHSFSLKFANELLRNAPNKLIADQIDEDGLLPHEVIRSRSTHYICYTLTPFMRIRAMAQSKGKAFYKLYLGEPDALLQKALEWTDHFMQRKAKFPYKDVDAEKGTLGDVWQRCIEPHAISLEIWGGSKQQHSKKSIQKQTEAYCIEQRVYGLPVALLYPQALALFRNAVC